MEIEWRTSVLINLPTINENANVSFICHLRTHSMYENCLYLMRCRACFKGLQIKTSFHKFFRSFQASFEDPYWWHCIYHPFMFYYQARLLTMCDGWGGWTSFISLMWISLAFNHSNCDHFSRRFLLWNSFRWILSRWMIFVLMFDHIE